jgi:hypothetical protein
MLLPAIWKNGARDEWRAGRDGACRQPREVWAILPRIRCATSAYKELRGMEASTFDRLTRTAIAGSRRDLLRALVAALAAAHVIPDRLAMAQSSGIVALGGLCSASADCVQHEMQGEAICADNGFISDGDLNCCANDGCCETDADCCGDLRCAVAYEICPGFCTRPPMPTRAVGQVCTASYDCFSWPGCFARCENQRCTCTVSPPLVDERSDLPDIPDSEAALAVAETVSGLEVMGGYRGLYDAMHPDARAIIPPEAVTGWYENEFMYRGEPAAKAIKVRFISWTWNVTGQTYPETAEVALRQQLTDGAVIRDEVRLVKDPLGNWSWFFGRDRAFVEEQIARYG